MGDKISSSPYVLEMAQNAYCSVLCHQKMSKVSREVYVVHLQWLWLGQLADGLDHSWAMLSGCTMVQLMPCIHDVSAGSIPLHLYPCTVHSSNGAYHERRSAGTDWLLLAASSTRLLC